MRSGVSGFVPITITIAVEGDSQRGGARFCVGIEFINSRRRSVGAVGTTECVFVVKAVAVFRRQRKRLGTSYLLDYCCDFDLTAASWRLVL